MNITLYDYQQKFYNDIINSLNNDINKLCCVLPTGGGKSVIIGKLANNLKGRTLILTHRVEILKQNKDWLNNCGILSSKINTLRYDNKIVIGMVQTVFSRIQKYGIEYLGNFDNIILDEIQILIFEKVFSKYNYKNLIGLTATPIIDKKIYTTIDGVEFVEPYTLSVMFDKLIQGLDTQDLIDNNKLVQDFNIVLNLPNFDKLKESDSSPDGYTKKSLNEVYINTASLDVLNKAYLQYGLNKKVLIFNASTKINKFVYEFFLKQGRNVKMFDSVNNTDINTNTNKKYTRSEIVEWFNNERDAILINTNVFTTGFNVTDVEVVVVNRATKSLSLWLQMVGRGSRTTTKIYKDKFTVIDLGQNIHTHGMWSKRRNWEDYFYSPGKKLKKKMDMLDTWTCIKCEHINIKGTICCEGCGAEKIDVVINGKMKSLKEGELQIVNDMPKPKANTIITYAISIGEGTAFAFNLLDKKIIELFIHYKVSGNYYNNRKDDFKNSVRKIWLPIYFAIIKNKDLKGPNITIENRLNRLFKKIDDIYK